MPYFEFAGFKEYIRANKVKQAMVIKRLVKAPGAAAYIQALRDANTLAPTGAKEGAMTENVDAVI